MVKSLIEVIEIYKKFKSEARVLKTGAVTIVGMEHSYFFLPSKTMSILAKNAKLAVAKMAECYIYLGTLENCGNNKEPRQVQILLLLLPF